MLKLKKLILMMIFVAIISSCFSCFSGVSNAKPTSKPNGQQAQQIYNPSIDYYLGYYSPIPPVCPIKNFLCNGNFEQPRVYSWKHFKKIPCWQGNDVFQIGKGSIYGTSFPSQVLELDARSGNKRYWQEFYLPYAGKYILKFEFAPRKGTTFRESSFQVYFNGQLLETVQPNCYAVRQRSYVVYGVQGQNKVDFQDQNHCRHSYGGVIDNVGVFIKPCQ